MMTRHEFLKDQLGPDYDANDSHTDDFLGAIFVREYHTRLESRLSSFGLTIKKFATDADANCWLLAKTGFDCCANSQTNGYPFGKFADSEVDRLWGPKK